MERLLSAYRLLVRYSVLGPVEVEGVEGPILVPARMERRLLALLVLNAGSVVSAGSLIDELWADDPPKTAAKTLQTYVSHLRRFLGHRLRTDPSGYCLDVDPDEIDASQFEVLVIEARQALARRDTKKSSAAFAMALELWRGVPYGDVADSGSLLVESQRLEELRLGAIEDFIDARIDTGDHQGLTAELEAFVTEHPFRERAWALLMRVLYAAGRQADALHAFQRVRSLLADELGLEPGPELRAIEAAVLNQDPLLAPWATNAPAARYVITDDGVEIAYWSRGTGARAVVLCLEWAFNLELLWDLTELRPLLDKLSDGNRLITVQRRDTGQSARTRPDGGLTPPQGCVPDLDAVLAVEGVDSVSLIGWGHGTQVALAYAAARPARVRRLVSVTGYARLVEGPDYPQGVPVAVMEWFLGEVLMRWGREMDGTEIFGPERGKDPVLLARAARLNRLTATPAQAVAMQRAVCDFDLRPLLPDVRCPALVIGLTGSITGLPNARALAEELPSATYVELPGYFVPTVEQSTVIGDEVVAFLNAS